MTGLLREIGPDDYDWGFTQFGDGTRKGGPRFKAARDRVFHIPRDPARGHTVDENLWFRVVAWIEGRGWMVDGWTFRTHPDNRIASAVWRFRAAQKAEAEEFAREWAGGPVSPH